MSNNSRADHFNSIVTDDIVSYNNARNIYSFVDSESQLNFYVQNTTSAIFKPGGVEIPVLETTGLIADTIQFSRNEFVVDQTVLTYGDAAIGDMSHIYSLGYSGFAIDNSRDPDNEQAGLQNDIRLWFPLDNNQDAIMFNTNPEMWTAAVNYKKDTETKQDPTVASVYHKFSVGDQFDDTHEDLGGIMYRTGHMGFFRDVTDFASTEYTAFDGASNALATDIILGITVKVRDASGIDVLGFEYADITAETNLNFNENCCADISSTQYIIETNTIPYMWASLQDLANRVIALEAFHM